MTEERLKEIEMRARSANPEGTTHSLVATTEAMRDVLPLIAEVRRLRQALRDYGRHDDARCEHFKRCVCGFDTALDGEGEP